MRQQISSFSFILVFSTTFPFFAQSEKPTWSSSSILDEGGEARESCPANVCFHGGTCFTKRLPDGTKEFECECLDGFTGDLCELKCTLPCQVTTATTQIPCPTPLLSQRNETTGEMECICPPGRAGEHCELEEAQCNGLEAKEKCQNGGQCIQMGTKASFCICPTGFSGSHCEKMDEEMAMPSESSNPKGEECSIKGRECLNGGKCIQRGNGDKNYCKCKGQFTGIWCDRPLRLTAGNGNDKENEESTTIESPNGKEEELASPEISINCSPNPCKNDGVCFPIENGQPHCNCPFGRSTGKFCQHKCHCPRGQGCVESTVELGRVECFRREEFNVHQNKTKITNDDEKEEKNNHPFVNNEEEEIDEVEAKEFVIDADVRNFNIFESATINGTDELVSGEGKMQRITMGERNVSSCLECENSVKCLENASKQIKCFCSPDYSGPLCDVKNSLCDFLGNCPKPGHRCRLHRGNPFKEDFAFCDCPLGMTGSKCAHPTLLGFTNNSSTLLLQSSNIKGGAKRKSDAGNDYKLALTFRTTLPFVHLATAETLLGHSEFSIWLENGQILLKIGGTNQSQAFGFDGLEMPLNDGEWYELRLWSTKEAGTGFEIHLSEGDYLLARQTLSASRLFSYSIWNTRIGTNFIGCMRDVSLNGEDPVESGDERAFAISPKCDRQKQCVNENQCQNGGLCIDYWDKFACECPRPFLPPKCGEQIREVTLGHGDAPSMVKFGLSQEEQKLVAEMTKISFLLRTNQQKNAPLFFIGEPTTNASSDPEMMTFISGEMERGTMKVNVRLGSKMVYGLRSGVPVNDNFVHLVEIEREGNELLLKVDQYEEPILRLSRPFEHPLLANELLIGGDGGIKFVPIDAFTSRNGTNGIGPFFRGTIQDFRINDHFVLFDSLPNEVEGENLPLFGQKQEEQNLLQGTISDDICALDVDQSSPCGEHGQCRNTFNDFECQCQSGWMGHRCEQRDFCGNSSICPNGSKCENVGGGFVCLTAATLTPNSALRFTMNSGNVIKSSSKHTNLTLEFRTRSLDGNLLKLHSSMESLSVQLRQGLLFLTAASIPFANSTPSFVSFPSNLSSLSDGQWHKLLIRQQTAPNGLQILVDGKEKDEEFFATNFSLKRFALDGQARISIGRLTDQQGFKGCIRNVRLGIFPPLSFLMAQQDAPPQMTDSLNSLPHFALQKRENIRTNMGCQSEDVCAKNPCLNGARCEDQFNQMHCECAQGFEGEFCELQKDECELMNGHKECGQNGKCVDELNGFRCQCAPAYSGPKCQQEEELCRTDSCKNGGKCQTINGTLHCECPSKFIGQWCQSEAGVKCSEQPCQNGGQCFQTTHGEIACTCRPGIIGPLCELRLDPCREMPCSNGGKCIPPPNNSTTPVDFRCDCSREFAGALCEKLVDICDRMGNASCNGHGRCENVWGGHRCICDEGWRGRDCSIRMDICQEEMPCQNGGICQTDQNNPNHFRCHCPSFYLGERCEIPGVCSENPCENGGECVQTSATEQHICRCARGFQGPACQHQIDFCATEPCLNGGNCQPLVGDFKCQCIPGFGGKRCEQDINECELPRSDGDGPACLHGGRCMDKVNGFECNCQGTGYKGSHCELDIDECAEAALNCQNGICLNLPGGYRCECKSGYIGQRCHVADPCVSNPLTNHSSHNCAHGKCVRSRVVMGAAGREFATHDCECFAGYTGELCMRLIEAQHAMTFYNFIGLGIVVLVCCISLGILLYFFVGCARRKRANQGTYSPSSQEMTGQARFVGTNSSSHRPAIIHPKHDNNHHHASIVDHHKPRRKQ